MLAGSTKIKHDAGWCWLMWMTGWLVCRWKGGFPPWQKHPGSWRKEGYRRKNCWQRVFAQLDSAVCLCVFNGNVPSSAHTPTNTQQSIRPCVQWTTPNSFTLQVVFILVTFCSGGVFGSFTTVLGNNYDPSASFQVQLLVQTRPPVFMRKQKSLMTQRENETATASSTPHSSGSGRQASPPYQTSNEPNWTSAD